MSGGVYYCPEEYATFLGGTQNVVRCAGVTEQGANFDFPLVYVPYVPDPLEGQNFELSMIDPAVAFQFFSAGFVIVAGAWAIGYACRHVLYAIRG